MKVTGETFSLFKKEKEPKGQDTKSIQTFRQKDRYRAKLWRALYQKVPTGQFLIFKKFPTEAFIIFLNFLGRIFQVKRQSRRVISLFFYPIFFY